MHLSHSKTLDCILVGFNDVSLEEYEKNLIRMRRTSGAYHQFAVDTLYFNGKRTSYIDLLQHTIANSELGIQLRHVGELPNLGLYYLANFLHRRGCTSMIVNNFIYQRQQLLAAIHEKPLCV